MMLSPLPDVMAQLDALLEWAKTSGRRQIVGIIGAPGAGKSTVANLIAERLGRERCAVVPMDGFHLANDVLEARGIRDRKGAIDTFDVAGYLALLGRLRRRDEPIVYAPTYRRGLEESIAGAIAVPQHIEIVLTEGNYLLADEPPWDRIRGFLDLSVFLETADDIRLERLIRRHISFGMEPDAARRFANGPDAANTRLVTATRVHADVAVTLD
jgi:pantothenate kinase